MKSNWKKQRALRNQKLLKSFKSYLVSLNSDIDKLHIEELEEVPTGLNSLKSKVHQLDVDKLVLVPVDLSKLNNVVKNDIKK